MFQAIARMFRVSMLWVLIAPYPVMFVGAASNQLVLVANHDKFPVMFNERVRVKAKPDVNGMIDNTHCVMTKQTHLNVLADIIDLHTGWYSIGDLFLMLGDWLSSFCSYVWLGLVLQKLCR